MRVLYATDGSIAAKEGGKLIAELFRRDGTRIHVLSVIPDDRYYDGIPDGMTFEPGELPSPPDGEEIAHEAAESLGSDGFKTTFGSVHGDPAHQVLRALETGNYQVAVLGSSHTTWMGSILLGSVSMPVLHHAPCSVLVTHRAPTGSDKVVLGVDGSRGSTDALHLAAGILDPARCSILVASVAPYPPIPLAVPYPGGTYVGHSRRYERLEKERIERARTLAEKAASYLRKNGFDAEAVVLEGSPGPQLLKEADGSNADLVVVGSRGVGALHRALLGSVSDQVARHAPATLIGRPQRLISKG